MPIRMQQSMRLLLTGSLIMVLFGVAIAPLAAQGDGESPPANGTTIHVVQRGETLFRIALKYGTTVEAISEANGISDPRYLAVGQRLLIPGAKIDTPGAVTLHTVQPGETLATIARGYDTTVADLTATNRVTNPALLFVGQELTINQGAPDPARPHAAHFHRVVAGENLFRIALRYGITLNALVRANEVVAPLISFPGQGLWIPGDGASALLRDLPAPFASYELLPIPAVQGQTLGIHLTTSQPARLSGEFMGYPVQVVTQDATRHFALFGVHAFAQSGIYPIRLTATTPDGAETILKLRVRVLEGGYGAEAISITTEKQDLLSSDVTEPEWQRFATVMSAFTAQRYFDGVMSLPSTGSITSSFGTRRSYNGGTLDTFHSGTDFGSPSGAPVMAPAGGVVVLAEHLPVRGNTTVLDHGWGVCTAYFHQAEIKVAVGDVVTSGQIIGSVGSTGRSTGPHLHWEMWVGGVQVDPMQWVQQAFP